jgi:NAD dependent epimerase/dehydratase family enzyme
MENEKIEGTYNAVAPNSVANKELVLEIARKEKGKSFISVHVPTFALKIRLGEMSVEVLKSATVSSEKIQNAGFIFQYPDIDSAILQLSHQKNLPA